ncbi:hypothetical protein KRP22_011277 [Phytophthora ramorum]|nr:hypothetical protein KRP22_15259 [Phytophthora ramorum]
MTTGPPTFPGICTADTAQHQIKQEAYFFGVNPTEPAGPFQGPPNLNIPNWRENDAVVQGLRTRNVVLIEQMLTNHAPHDVLTQLAVKIERLMFNTATSREDYLNEGTLRTRVQNLSRNLIQLRKRKNMISENFAALSMD